MDRYQYPPHHRSRSVRPRSSDYDPEYPPSPYDRPYASSRHGGGRRASVIPMSTSYSHYEPFASGHRRPTMSRSRFGDGYGHDYQCGMGEYFAGYEPVMERPRRELYGMGGRRRGYDVEEMDDEYMWDVGRNRHRGRDGR